MSVWVMISTAGSVKEAERIAQTLVRERLAACVSVIPGITSFFFWEEKLSREKEALLLAKCGKKQTGKIIRRIKEIHSYQVPEILFFQVAREEKQYARWVAQSLGKKRIDSNSRKR